MGLAIGLTMHNFRRPSSLADPAWVKPDRQLCDALNAPAALIRFGLTQLANGLPNRDPNHMFIETTIYFVLVGLLWYAVAIEISGRGQSILARRSGMRKSADILGIFFGVILGTVTAISDFGGSAAYIKLAAITWFIWAVVIVSFYGHDLRASLRRAVDVPSA
jgi:hypothetical protein